MSREGSKKPRLIECQNCSIEDHSEDNLSLCAPKSRKTLRDSLAPLQKVQVDIAGAEKTLDTEHANVDAQKEVCKSIQQSFDALRALVDQREIELVKKATTFSQEKKDALSDQKKVFQVAQKRNPAFDGDSRDSRVENDQDQMSIYLPLQTKIEEEEKCHGKLSLKPTAIAVISCNLPSPDIMPKNLGSVSLHPTPVLLDKIDSCELGSPVQVSLVEYHL